VIEPEQASGAIPLVGAKLDDALAEAQARYRQLEERFHALENATGQLTWVTDSQGMVEDMPGWRAFTGASVTEVSGIGWVTTLHPADRENAQAAWSVPIRDGRPYQTEYRVRRRDGIYRWFVARGMPIFAADGTICEWVGTSTDITERKMIERELVERANQLDATFATIADGVFVYGIDGSIRMMNPAVYHLFGLAQDDQVFAALSAAERAEFLQLRDEDDHPLAADQLPTTRILRGETLATAVRLRTRDGRDCVMGIQAHPSAMSRGRSLGGSRSIATSPSAKPPKCEPWPP